MALRTISTPQVTVNNENIRIVPGSLMYDAGEGGVNVRAASVGGRAVESVHSEDAETKLGTVKFKVFLTGDLDAKIASWKAAIAENAISFSQKTGGDSIVRQFVNMSCTEPVEREAGPDSEVELVFMGDPMVGT